MTNVGSVGFTSTVLKLANGIPANTTTRGRPPIPTRWLAGVQTQQGQGQLWFSANASLSKQPVYKAIVKAPTFYQPRWRAWATGFDSSWKLNGEVGIGSASLTHKTGGLAGGLDYQFAPDVLAGFAMGGSNSTFSVPSRSTSGQLEGGHFGAYGVKTSGSLYAAGAVSFSTFRNSTNRMSRGLAQLKSRPATLAAISGAVAWRWARSSYSAGLG